VIERPSRIAISGGTIAALSAIVTAVATTSSATNSGPLRGGSIAAKAYATSIAGVDDPARLIRSARQRYRSTIHTAPYESAGITNAGAGPRNPTASMSAAKAADTVSDVEYRAATSSAATAHVASSAASGVNRSLRSESASPTSPTATRRPAMTAARLGWGPRRLSMAYGKLARALPVLRTTWTNVPTPRLSATVACGPDLRSEAAARRPEPRRRRIDIRLPASCGGRILPWMERGNGIGARRRCAHEGMDQRPPMNMLDASFPALTLGGLGGTDNRASRGRLVETPRVRGAFGRKYADEGMKACQGNAQSETKIPCKLCGPCASCGGL